ncbi:MAG TPA: hypothetical protein DIT48_05450 [Actinobacteria bacterium]|jgi:hypothetical protein|nr:hypothetical protein [Actinomycetota bacterium]
MAVPATAVAVARPTGGRKVIGILLVGAAVAVGLGVYGRVHDPTGRSLLTLVFTRSINLKVWFATIAFALALFQLGSALRIYGKIGSGRPPKWLRSAHRLSGTLAFLFVIPVAYHCLWALGFQPHFGLRVLAHGVAGCFFFGALASKVLIVRSSRMPSWALPVMGGSVFAALTIVWLTSALWFFTHVSFPGF